MTALPRLILALGFFAGCAPVFAQDAVTLADVPEKLEPIFPDEPMAAEFSAANAARYLDRASLTWQKVKNCATCHTNMPYLMARPALAEISADSGEVRAFYETYPAERWAKRSPNEKQGFWTIVVATGLTFHDLQTTGKLSDPAREALDAMWTVQREDGGWRWPDCNYAPMEIDDHYGVTLAALTVGVAPDGYSQSEKARTGLAQLRGYLENDPAKSLHHRAMLAWCSKRLDGIQTEAQRAETLTELLALQLPGGGWSTSSFLADWDGLEREDGEPLDTKTGDAYGTGLVIVIARELGIPADDPRLRRGIEWLLANQRESGKWFTRSPVADARNLISNTGSAFAVLALQACGELPGWPLK